MRPSERNTVSCERKKVNRQNIWVSCDPAYLFLILFILVIFFIVVLFFVVFWKKVVSEFHIKYRQLVFTSRVAAESYRGACSEEAEEEEEGDICFF